MRPEQSASELTPPLPSHSTLPAPADAGHQELLRVVERGTLLGGVPIELGGALVAASGRAGEFIVKVVASVSGVYVRCERSRRRGASQVREASRLDARARRTMALLYRRLLEIGLWRHIRSVGGALTTGAGGAHFTTRDNRAFLQDLLATGCFCRDTPGGGMLHRGQISVREITNGPGLHLSLGDNNRIYVHIDTVSPAVGAAADGACRYDRARSLSHMRREVFPLVMRFHQSSSPENKSRRRARFNLYDAQRAWCIAVQAGRKEESLEAGVRLAGLLAAQRETSWKRAQRLYRQAIESGHENFAPAAAFGLGILLEELERTSQAQEAYTKAITSAHSEFAPLAAYNLGVLLERLEDPDGAQKAYEQAIAFGHPEVTCWAGLKLGDILARQGDHKKAQDIYELVIALRHPEFASLGALNLARLHRDRGGKDSARTAYERAIAMGPPETAETAAEELAALLQDSVDRKQDAKA
jgi:tetratricopeptide (TPR) repeat protein